MRRRWQVFATWFRGLGHTRWLAVINMGLALGFGSFALVKLATASSSASRDLGMWMLDASVAMGVMAGLQISSSKWQRRALFQQGMRAAAEQMAAEMSKQLSDLRAPDGECPECRESFRLGFAAAVKSAQQLKEEQEREQQHIAPVIQIAKNKVAPR